MGEFFKISKLAQVRFFERYQLFFAVDELQREVVLVEDSSGIDSAVARHHVNIAVFRENFGVGIDDGALDVVALAARADIGEVRADARTLGAHAVTIEAALALEDGFAVGQVRFTGAGGVVCGGQRSKIRDNLVRLLVAQIRRRHGRPLDALQHDGDQLIVGGRAAKGPVAEIDARNRVSIRTMAGGTIHTVELFAGLDVGGTVALLRAQRASHKNEASYAGRPQKSRTPPPTRHHRSTFFQNWSFGRYLNSGKVGGVNVGWVVGDWGQGVGGSGRIRGIFVFADAFFWSAGENRAKAASKACQLSCLDASRVGGRSRLARIGRLLSRREIMLRQAG